jgi:CRP/FNR family cyclic AMP-dependent transcriptional regulator
MNEDLRTAVLAVKILAELPQPELTELLPCLSLVKAKVGDSIIRENALDTAVYFIAEGQAKICHADKDGKEVILALVKPGDVFGEMAALIQSPRTSDVIATLPCVLIQISAQDILKHFEHWPGLSLKLLKSMSHKLFGASLRIRELALHDVTTRTVQILLSISEIAEFEERLLPIVNPRPTHQALASMVGTSREVISRTLKVLEEAGQIRIEEDRLILIRS